MRELDALLAFVALGWRSAAAQRAAIAARGGLYVLILVIWWQLWQATPLAELGRSDVTAVGLLWYVAVTEWIVFAAGMPYREVEADIRDGRIATALTRPLPYVAAVLAQWAGEAAYRLLALGAIGFAAAFWLTGTVPATGGKWAGIALAGVLGIAALLLCQVAIGMAAAWSGVAAPLYWIWQKLLFVLGGLLMPLTFYPPALRGLADLTPFAAILFAPASLAFDPSAAIGPVLAIQLAWLAVLAAGAVLVGRAAIARLIDRGA